MNTYLIYLSEQIIQDTKVANAVIGGLSKLGDVAMGDFNVQVIQTEAEGEAVRRAIEALVPPGANYFVAAVEDDHIGYGGNAQFDFAMRKLKSRPES